MSRRTIVSSLRKRIRETRGIYVCISIIVDIYAVYVILRIFAPFHFAFRRSSNTTRKSSNTNAFNVCHSVIC